MAAKYSTRLRIAKQDILRKFDSLDSKVLTIEQMRKVLSENRNFWRLGNITFSQFVERMQENTPLREVRLDFPFRPVTRFSWGEASVYELVQSINEDGYFSHYTAMRHHGLTLQIPKTIYFNIEQSVRPGGGTLAQDRIDRAFKAKCRTSSNQVRFVDYTICLLNGGNTGQLGVVTAPTPAVAAPIRVTNLERTLIDATTRPIYSGGVYEVRAAFQAAKERVSVNKLVATLKRIGYTYPYHQSIGFYMQRAGYRESQLALLRKLPMEFDFYLDYALKETDYDSRWRLHFPKNF
jgi:predicted transcriptional regulator of viral defense system